MATQLVTMDLDGHNMRKLMDLPGFDIASSAVYPSDDRSAFVLETYGFAQYVVTTRTGRAIRLSSGQGLADGRLVKAWIDRAPPAAETGVVSLGVAPSGGPRGTVFRAQVSGAPSGQPFVWFLTSPSGREIVKKSDWLDTQGSATFIALSSGLTSESGAYTLDLRVGRRTPDSREGTSAAKATFSILD